jgi:hypothetical protein
MGEEEGSFIVPGFASMSRTELRARDRASGVISALAAGSQLFDPAPTVSDTRLPPPAPPVNWLINF